MMQIRNSKGVLINPGNYAKLVMPKVFEAFAASMTSHSNSEIAEYDLLRYFGLWLDDLSINDPVFQ
jgi:hypothetical protein